MIISLLYTFLILFGGTILLLSLIFLRISVKKKSSKLKKIALGLGIVTIIYFSLLVFKYTRPQPIRPATIVSKDFTDIINGTYDLQKLEGELVDYSDIIQKYSGSYEILGYKGEQKQIDSKLKLNSDKTYTFEGKPYSKLSKYGTWTTGGNDGYFQFYDEDEDLIEFALPSGGNGNYYLIFNPYASNEIKFVKLKIFNKDTIKR